MIKFENVANGRYYYLITDKDMLNALVLTIIRGGRHARRVHHHVYDCVSELSKAIERISKIRLRHGYTLVS